jgi:hypothetical protein
VQCFSLEAQVRSRLICWVLELAGGLHNSQHIVGNKEEDEEEEAEGFC